MLTNEELNSAIPLLKERFDWLEYNLEVYSIGKMKQFKLKPKCLELIQMDRQQPDKTPKIEFKMAWHEHTNPMAKLLWNNPVLNYIYAMGGL